jgi:hypothetical protein
MAWVRAGGKLLLPIGSLFTYYRFMPRSIPVLRKRRGRPPTGQDPVTAVRLPLALKSQIDDWAKRQPDNPSRSEAIRRLVQLALAAKGKQR